MITINAEIRKEKGKSASRRLRADNWFPAIIYGGKNVPILIKLDHQKIWNIQKKSMFYNGTLNIFLNGKEEKVKVKAVQRHAFKPRLTHIDFIRIL